MDVEKIIRVLGYIVYMLLWSPFIVLSILALPIVILAVDLREGRSVKGSFMAIKTMFEEIVRHDIEFIQTGKW